MLYPFNLGNSHWVSVEIKIHKEGHQYRCSVYLYDPQYSPREEIGHSQLQEVHFTRVAAAIEHRIKEYDTQAEIIIGNEVSLYPEARQAADNIVDCGLYAVLDIVKRIAGQPLVPSNQSPLKLREEMVDVMRIAAATMREAGDNNRAGAVDRCADKNEQRLQQYESASFRKYR